MKKSESSELSFEDIYLQMAEKNSNQKNNLLNEDKSKSDVYCCCIDFYNCLLDYCCFFL